jgi:tetratricopeptide (TPR) repeat protein
VSPVAEKHYAAAVHLYTQATEIQPDNAVLYANRAFAHIKIEEYGSAVMDASKAIAADPTYAKVQQQVEAAQLLRFGPRARLGPADRGLHVAVVQQQLPPEHRLSQQQEGSLVPAPTRQQ